MRKHTWIALTVLAVGMAGLASAQTAPHHKSRKARKPAKEFVLPPLPRGPLQQVPLDQLPSVPPQVSYQNGNLTIVAENSTLGDILREVRKQTGASIDVPGNPTERVAMRVGPGAARDVLATLLNGTSFNYVMVGSPSNPVVLSSIVLTSRPAGPGTETAQYQPPPVVNNFGPGTGRPGMAPFVPPPGQHPIPLNQAAAQNADSSDDSDSADDDSSDDSDQDQQADVQADQNNGENGQQPNVGPRTPQQILQMMQRNQQQQPGQPPQPPQQAPNQEQQ